MATRSCAHGVRGSRVPTPVVFHRSRTVCAFAASLRALQRGTPAARSIARTRPARLSTYLPTTRSARRRTPLPAHTTLPPALFCYTLAACCQRNPGRAFLPHASHLLKPRSPRPLGGALPHRCCDVADVGWTSPAAQYLRCAAAAHTCRCSHRHAMTADFAYCSLSRAPLRGRYLPPAWSVVDGAEGLPSRNPFPLPAALLRRARMAVPHLAPPPRAHTACTSPLPRTAALPVCCLRAGCLARGSFCAAARTHACARAACRHLRLHLPHSLPPSPRIFATARA